MQFSFECIKEDLHLLLVLEVLHKWAKRAEVLAKGNVHVHSSGATHCRWLIKPHQFRNLFKTWCLPGHRVAHDRRAIPLLIRIGSYTGSRCHKATPFTNEACNACSVSSAMRLSR